jgi:hypothetical protein
MNAYIKTLCAFIFIVVSGFSSNSLEDIQFVCMKTHKASNTCHFNFKVDGANYRFVDVGCRYNKKKDELIRKVESGSVFLAKDWKISCPESKKGDSESGL